jgi:hypothetical protein
VFRNLSSSTTRSAPEFCAFGSSVEAFENQMFVEHDLFLRKSSFPPSKASGFKLKADIDPRTTEVRV